MIYLAAPFAFEQFRFRSAVLVRCIYFGSIGICGLLPIVLGMVALRRALRLHVGGWRNGIIAIALGAANCAAVPLGSHYLHHRAVLDYGYSHGWVRCAINMQAIGQRILSYRIDHGGKYPNILDDILAVGELTTDYFVCPLSSMKAAPPGSISVVGATSYIYLGAGLTEPVDPKVVILYEQPADHANYGNDVNFLYADGQVAAIKRGSAEAIIKQLESGVNPPNE